MIQLKETDFLWKMYKRWYQSEKFKYEGGCPHPRSLCNFFWKSMGGVWMTLFWDLPFLLTAPLFVGVAWGMSELTDLNKKDANFLDIIQAFVLFGFVVAAVVHVIGRLMDMAVRRNQEWMIPAVILGMVFCGLSCLMAIVFGKPLTFWKFLGGAGILAGTVFALLAIFYLWDRFRDPESQTGRVVGEYVGAVKRRICPRILIPGETPPGEKKNETGLEGERVGGQS